MHHICLNIQLLDSCIVVHYWMHMVVKVLMAMIVASTMMLLLILL
jgi:hypothetical protein